MSHYALAVVGLGLTLFAGCAASESRELEYRLTKAEAERDQLRTALEDERAKVVIVQERLATQQREHEILGAEADLLRERARQLEQDNDELVALLNRRDGAATERPQVSASPLPENIDRQLQAFATRHEGIWYDRARAAVSFAGHRLFESGSDEVRAGAQPALGELAGIAALTPAEDFEIIIVGHTDSMPISDPATLARHPSNWHLSVHRAIAVKNTLVSAGLPETRTAVMGYGACRPLGADPARNRRVEVYFARKGEVKALTPAAVPSQSALESADFPR